MSRPGLLPTSTVDVSMHVYAGTALQPVAYPLQDRVMVRVAGSGGAVTLFLPREEVGRLRESLDRAERELTQGQDETAAQMTVATELGAVSAA